MSRSAAASLDVDLVALVHAHAWIRVLLRALELYDGGATYGHHWRVARKITIIWRRAGVSASMVNDRQRGALLHDIGKLLVPRSIILKAGKPTVEERRELRRHPRLGFELLREEDIEAALDVVGHHECAWQLVDVQHRNYPRAGERRSNERRLIARVLGCERRTGERRADDAARRPFRFALAVADVIDALSSGDRSYCASHTNGEIREILAKHFGVVPDIAEWLLEAREELLRPVPSIVKGEV
ncbi:MAG: HD domain-containing protein [Candidatus Uhrbacteria bacterium]